MTSHLTPTLSQGSTHTPNESLEAGTTLDDAPVAGRRLGRYVVLRRLGEGGMGVVYSAYDELLARRVALKLVRTDASGSAAHARILREAQALARLSHPHVVQVYEVSAAAGQVFLAMEQVEGDTLRAWTAGRRAAGVRLRELLDMYIQAGRGLAAAHAAGLVHRDFKPDNVLVGVDGRARVADFGLVAAGPDEVAGAERVELTGAGLLGTPAYMSPEQFAGLAADARSDQFSFCVALYEAVCGVRPFAGEGVEALRAAVAGGVVRAPPELPPWLWALIGRGLAGDPADRFATMDELLAGLARDPAEVRRRRIRVAGVVVVSGVLAVLVAWLVQEQRQRWLLERREQAAAQALATAEARIAAAWAAGDRAAGEQILAAFVGEPAHEGTAAVARAWLGEADRRAAEGARDAARAAFATAYLTAPSGAQQAEALVGLVRHFRGGGDVDEFAGAFALLERSHPEVAGGPVLADMRVEAALARRDLAGARAAALELDAAAPLRRLALALDGATPTSFRGVEEVALNGSHVLLSATFGDPPALHLARNDAGLTPVRTIPLPAGTGSLDIAATDPFMVAIDAWPDRRLVRIDAAGETTLATWTAGNFAVAAADLDADGTRELYVGSGATNGIEMAEPGTGWARETVYSHVEALDSAVHGLAALDLDGDGREELVAGFDGWHAFDVRVFRRAPGSRRLELVARDKLGASRGLTRVRVGGSTLLAVNHLSLEGSTLVFPPGRDGGEPTGVYLYGFDGASLVRRGHLPLAHDNWGLWAGDVDGDGRDDLAVREGETQLRATVLQLQGEAGFTPVHVGQLRVLALAQLDGDAAHEVIAEIEDGDGGPSRVWTIGAGDGALPPIAGPPSDAAALVDPEDATWTRQAGDAAALADLGLLVDAAEALHGLGRRTPRPELRGAAFVRAAQLFERALRGRDAVALWRAAAAVPAVASAAYTGLLRAQLRVGDYDEAGETLATALARGDLSAEARAELTRHDLAAGLAGRVDIDLREPLAPGWTLTDARALRRDPEGLVVETMAPGVLMSLPVELSGDLFELSADLSIRQFEWSHDLEIGLVAGDDPLGAMAVKSQIQSSGTSRGGFLVTRHYSCAVGQARLVGHSQDDGVPYQDVPLRVEVRVAYAAALGEVGCETRVHGAPGSRHIRRRDVSPPPAGRYHLVVRVRNDMPAWFDATLHHLRLRGARVREEAPADPARAELQRAVLARDAAATLAAVATVASPTARERGWQAEALLQLGRRAEADALWTALLAAPLDPDLASRLRGEPATVGPHLHALDPAGQPARLVAVWRNTAVNHLGDPQARRAMGAALAALDVDAALALARSDAARGDIGELLGWRARLWTYAGEPARARRAFERALEIVAALPPDAAPRVNAWRLWIELASLAAAGGDPGGAREAVRRARASSDMPMLIDDVVRARPALARAVE